MQVIWQNLFHAPINVEITGRNSFTPLGKVRVNTVIFRKVILARNFCKNCCTKLHENPTNALVTDREMVRRTEISVTKFVPFYNFVKN
jgi:hypothetical protein